ncbi:MAG: hypothetical protein WBF90_05675 [Rivularia sp. (in: cyanobacteria)]
MNLTEEYKRYLKIFSFLTSEAIRLSNNLPSIVSKRSQDISNENFVFLSIYSKIILHANSILSILPKDEPGQLYGSDNFKLLDFSSVASLTRDIIDADNTLFYLFTEKVDDSEREFRLLLFGLHGYMREKEFISLVGGLGHEKIIDDISTQINIFLEKLEKNSFFRNLKVEIEQGTQRGKRAKEVFKRKDGRIENVKDALFLTRKEIIKIRGMDLPFFDAMYLFLSSHVHSYLMGTSLVGSSIVFDEKSLAFLLKTISNAAFYLCLAMIDTTILFPETEEKLNSESRRILQSIIRGESFIL